MAHEGKAGAWSIYFYAKPYSNAKLRKLTDPALQALEDLDNRTSTEWEVPTDMPLPLLEWFQGQFHVLFKHPIKSFDDVIHSLEEELLVRVPSSHEPLIWTFQYILLRQRNKLQDVTLSHQTL
jgi:hypothetical protein